MPASDYSDEIRKAVRCYWRTKKAAQKKNQSGKKADAGNRGGATAGKNLDGFGEIFAALAKKVSPLSHVYQNKSQVILPGHFRPTKQWDLVVIHEGKLIATLELKSLGGPSFGNNANNRCEEALGSGLDLSVAQREGLFGAGATPFVGYCILVEDEDKSRSIPKRGNPSVHFDSDPVFKTASYQERMRILCERMVQERRYTAAAVLTSPPSASKSGDFKDLSTATSLNRLLQKFLAHIQIETGG
ncbi:restriction endonuclease [bacterium]|nr:restriction endonuclease [bacterium]